MTIPEAHAHPRGALIAELAGFPARLEAAAIPASATSAPGDDGEWGVAEIVRHLIAVEQGVWHVRLSQLETEDHPRWRWVEPGQWD